MNNWNEDCSLDLSAALGDPSQSGVDILNPNAQDPEFPQIPLDIQLGLYFSGVWREHRLYVKPDSIKGKERAGFENSTMQFVLQDWKDYSILPYSPAAIKGQRVRLLNGNGTDTYFKGYVRSAIPDAFQQSKINFRDLANWNVSCVNEMYLFKRVPIGEIQKDVSTQGAMLADLTGRYCPEFDISGINLEIGNAVDRKTIDGLFLWQLYDEFLKEHPDMAFYLDITQEPSRIYLDRRDALSVLLPIELTDTNLYNYCRPGQFQLGYNEDEECNSVRVRYPRLYNKGTVDVDPAGNIVYGTDTDFFGNVNVGNRFRIEGSDDSYNVDNNLSTEDGLTEELYLTGNYKGALATGLNYEVISDELFEVSEQDDTAIENKAQLTGETGEYAGYRELVLVESTPLTDEEAQRLAEVRLSQDAYEGFFQTNNILFPVANLRAGRPIRCNMPQRGIQAKEIPIQEIDWWIRSGKVQPRSGRQDPRIDYRMDFTNRNTSSISVFRQLLLAGRKTPVRDQGSLKIYKNISHRFAVGHCAVATEGEDAIHEFSYSYSAQADEVFDTDFLAVRYPGDLAVGQLGMDPIDLDNPLSLWFPS